MATKTRSKKEGDTVTDTATTEAEVTPEVTPDVQSAEAPAAPAEAPKPAVDHEANLTAAIMAFATDPDRKIEPLQEAYRVVPVAARGKVQGVALKNAMTQGVDLGLLGQILEAFNTLPTAAKTPRVKPDIDPQVEAAIRLTGLMVAFDGLRAELGQEAFDQAVAWHNGGGTNLMIPADYQSYVQGVATSVSNSSKVKSSGQRGPRTTFKESFAELVSRGGIPAGSTLKAGDVTATVTADGKIETSKGIFDAPSAAAKAVHQTKDGKDTATNGWKFWTYNVDGKDVPIGDLRNS